MAHARRTRALLCAFWLIWPEEGALIAHALDGSGYRVVATLKTAEHGSARMPPFEAMELDLAGMLE